MKRMWTDESLSQLSDSVNGKFAGLASAVSDAMTEVHENMKELEGNICTDEEARGGVARLQEALDAVDSAVALLRNEISGIVVPTKVSELQNDSGFKTTDTTYGAATAAAAGLMSAADKAKLDGIQAGAQVNQTVTKASLGLDKVNNTADAEKIVKGIATEAVPASADTERYIYFSRVADAADLARPVYDTELTYNPKQKRITARNLLLEKDAEEEVAVWVKNALHAITLVSKSGNAGVYDKTKNKWMIRYDADGACLIADATRKSNEQHPAIGEHTVNLGGVDCAMGKIYAVVYGYGCISDGTSSFCGGWNAEATGEQAVSMGIGTHSKGKASFATGVNLSAYGEGSFCNGVGNYAEGTGTHSEGYSTYVAGLYGGYAGGNGCIATTLDNYIPLASYSGNTVVVATDRGIDRLDATLSRITAGMQLRVWNNHYANKMVAHYVIAGVDVTNHTITLETALPTSNFGVRHAVVCACFNTNGRYQPGFATGNSSVSLGDSSFAAGTGNFAVGSSTHAVGSENVVCGNWGHAEGRLNAVKTDAGHAEGANNTVTGAASHVEGKLNTVSGKYSHAEGYECTTTQTGAHAEGHGTHAEGLETHTEGRSSAATGNSAHAEGQETQAIGHASHAAGYRTTANGNASYVIGHRNVATATTAAISNKLGHAFVVGNGISDTALSNAFSIMFDGTVKAAKTVTGSTAADYAELFEWQDGNRNAEDLVGKFVTLDGDKIRIADSSDDYILGIVSGCPFVLGNGDCDTWNNMYLRDDFNRLIMEPAPKIETVYVFEDGHEETYDEMQAKKIAAGTVHSDSVDESSEEKINVDSSPVDSYYREAVDEDGNIVYEGTRPKLNPDYDNTQKYISRMDRPEWAPIGMLGVLTVIQDGTLKVNGYCMCGDGGTATDCDLPGCGYRVIRVINDNLAKVVFREAQPVSVGRKLQKLLGGVA